MNLLHELFNILNLKNQINSTDHYFEQFDSTKAIALMNLWVELVSLNEPYEQSYLLN